MASTKIISFENVDGKEVMNFDKCKLQELLRPVKDLPICVISVTSKEECRLITFLLAKYLKNEFPSTWNSNNIPHFPKVIEAEKACGICIHGEPLIVNTNDDSETIAVILLEANGNYDAKMDESWKKTVGLSMYLSSQLIMSCSNFIPEHVLTDIKFNCPTNEDKVGLKQLIFLVQDWNKTNEHPVGNTGGDEFLQAKFKENNGQPSRLAIKMSFEAIQCFLLPNAPFLTPIRQEDTNNTYLSIVENFFTRYFAPNNLIVKHHFGKELKAAQIPEYVEMYTAVLTGDSKVSLAKATIKQFKQMQIKEAKEVTEYWKKENQDKMSKTAENALNTVFMQFGENMVVYDEPQTEQKIVNNYEKYSEEARNQFLILGESLPTYISKEFMEQLNSKMLVVKNDVFEVLKRKMKITEETYMNAYVQSLCWFSNKFFTFSLKKQFYHDEMLNEESEKLKRESVQVFLDFPKISHNKETNALFLSKLKADIDLYSNEIVAKNRQTKESILTQISTHKERCKKLFDDEYKKSYILARDEEILKKNYEKANQTATNDFLSKMTDIDDEIWGEDLEEIESHTQKTYHDSLEICQFIIWPKQERTTNNALVDARAFYHEQMKSHKASRRFFNPTELDKIHKKTVKLAIAKAAESVTLNSDQKEDLENYLKVSYNPYRDQNLMDLPQDPVIGIDHGTTYTCVALHYKGEVIVITNRHGQKTTPSYVAFRNGITTVGFSAKKLAYENTHSTIFDAKRLMGLQYNDPNVQNHILQWPFKVIEHNTKCKIQIGSSAYYPEQISAKILQEMKTIAEDYIGAPGIIKKCVITVAAHFNDSQREATIDAGRMAGMEVIRIINEPTAAAISYKMRYTDSHTRNILIFDLGGGTLDVAILEIKKGEINVKAVDGNTHLGGEDFDNRVAEFCTREFERINGRALFPERDSINLNQQWNYQATQRLLRDACEESKIRLSTETEVHVLERILNLDVVLTRKKFEELNEDLFEETIEIVETALK